MGGWQGTFNGERIKDTDIGEKWNKNSSNRGSVEKCARTKRCIKRRTKNKKRIGLVLRAGDISNGETRKSNIKIHSLTIFLRIQHDFDGDIGIECCREYQLCYWRCYQEFMIYISFFSRWNYAKVIGKLYIFMGNFMRIFLAHFFAITT